MKLRTIKIAAVAAAIGGAPMLGMAANSQVVLDRCVKAFMSKPTNAGAFRLRDAHYASDGSVPDSNLNLGGQRELLLTAHDAHDNHTVARAACTVNSRGEVVDLRPAPLFALEPF